MKTIMYFICCLCLFSGCKNSKQSDSLNETDKKEAIIEIDLSTIVHPNLLQKIKEYTTNSNSRRYEELNVIDVVIWKLNKDYHIVTSQKPFYYLNGLEGYLIIDNKMVAFYYDDEKYVNSWVDTDKLIKAVPPEKYVDDETDCVKSNYVSQGKTFKVNSEEMTLELVHQW